MMTAREPASDCPRQEPAFANILFSGRCNLRCPDCIGRQLGPRRPDNLGLFPPRNLAAFCAVLVREGVRELSLTGSNTDPMLYRHQEALVHTLRRRIPGVRLSLHTNGQLALSHLALFHLYDRAAVSVPSLEFDTYRAMTGGGRLFDLGDLLLASRIPIKVSVLVTHRNLDEIPRLLAGLQQLGVRRAVLRRCLGMPLPDTLLPQRTPHHTFAANPVYDLDGMEVTDWRFETTTLRCFNLFSDGSMAGDYLLGPARAA
ncbi:MAG: radical SAM protein [Pseudomonadota bacterium]